MADICDDCSLAPCPDCAPIEIPPSDPLDVLRRLPPALFNLSPPSEETVPALLAGDPIDDFTVLGPLGSDDATPQYEIARVLAREKDAFILALVQSAALQLGTGGGSTPNCPCARGDDLDRYWGQFGIGRPRGFDDCCYQRLCQLILFDRRGLWKLIAIAELYTGLRPTPVEAPCSLALVWPEPETNPLGSAFLDDADTELDDTAFLDTDLTPTVSDDAGYFPAAAWQPQHQYALGDSITDGVHVQTCTSPGTSGASAPTWNDTPTLTTPDGPTLVWTCTTINGVITSETPTSVLDDVVVLNGALGLTLEQALRLAKGDGIALALVNAPVVDASGCAGATERAPVQQPGMWS